MKYLVAFLLLFPNLLENPQKDYKAEDLACLTANLYFEARGDSTEGLQAVADVTMNRVRSKIYPKSVCLVVFQKKQFSWTHQVSWNQIQRALNGLEPSKNPLEVSAYQRCKIIASRVVLSDSKVLPESVMWYHSLDVKPIWRLGLKKYKVIGKHVFYESK